MNETKPKKMVSRNIAIALGIICIVLIALIAYFSVTGISATNSYNNLQNQNKQLQTWLDGNETLLNQTQTWLAGNITSYEVQINGTNNNLNKLLTFISSLTLALYNSSEVNTAITDLNWTVNELTAMVTGEMNTIDSLNALLNLHNSTVWVNNQTINQAAGASYQWIESTNYAGYISINVLSNASSAYTFLYYSADGVNYDNSISVGTNGTAYFPVLPSSSITVEVGNNNLVNGATETVTITYYY